MPFFISWLLNSISTLNLASFSQISGIAVGRVEELDKHIAEFNKFLTFDL